MRSCFWVATSFCRGPGRWRRSVSIRAVPPSFCSLAAAVAAAAKLQKDGGTARIETERRHRPGPRQKLVATQKQDRIDLARPGRPPLHRPGAGGSETARPDDQNEV